MQSLKWTLAAVLAAFLLTGSSNPLDAAGRSRPAGPQKEEPSRKEAPERAIARAINQMQMDLEGSSSRGVLGLIDSAKFDDYPRFEDMIERLLRENSLRVYFRQVTSSVQETTAQTIIDAEMEMTRKDSAGRIERRREQLVIDFQRTERGWRIINLTPREFFRPL